MKKVKHDRLFTLLVVFSQFKLYMTTQVDVPPRSSATGTYEIPHGSEWFRVFQHLS